jgi:hypothetical protein
MPLGDLIPVEPRKLAQRYIEMGQLPLLYGARLGGGSEHALDPLFVPPHERLNLLSRNLSGHFRFDDFAARVDLNARSALIAHENSDLL